MKIHNIMLGVIALFFVAAGYLQAAQSDVLQTQADEKGRNELMLQLPLKTLTELDVSGYE